MQHSHEGLDRPGGFSRVNLLSPLRHRDFRLLWAGMTVSLVGDGIFLIAMAWQAYELWNAPAALSLLGIGMTIPTIAFLLPAGVLSDRLDRRSLMLAADVVRAVVVAVLAALSLTGLLTFWELFAIVAVYGVGTAFFTPAFEAIVPDIVPASDLPAANSLDQFVRPIALRLAGPALGGVPWPPSARERRSRSTPPPSPPPRWRSS
jgi:DHA3 family tetracycline resistance protein-like MFS transporter